MGYKQKTKPAITYGAKEFLSKGVKIIDNKIQLKWVDDMNYFPQGTGLLLDYGAGQGNFKERLENLGYRWIGFDTKKNEGPLSLIAEGQRLPFINESFNIVFFRQVLQYISEPQKALREIWRVLKKDACLYGSVSFLGPFDDCFFGFSHWGIEKMLNDANFNLVTLIPAESVFLLIMHNMIDRTGTNWAPLITRIIMTPFFLIFKIVEKYFLIKFAKNSKKCNKFKRFLYKMPLRFAGRIIFIAKKRA